VLNLVTLLLVSTIYYLAGSDSSQVSAGITPKANEDGKPETKDNAGEKRNDRSGETSTPMAAAALEPSRPIARSGLGSTFPQALLIPPTLSKRLHSIYMLRLFNDPFAMVLLYAAVVVMMAGRHHPAGWIIGCGLYS
jgi:hypothetical protein